MESLPSDIVQDIFSRVPVESILECKLVCKTWATLILAVKVESCLFFACCINGGGIQTTLLFHGRQLSDRISIDEKYIYSENLTRIYHTPMLHKPYSKHLVGSCNGLVCAFQRQNFIIDPIYICNPLTREYVHLPELVVKKEDIDPDSLRMTKGKVNMYDRTASGFGYVQSTNEYKVVIIHYVKYAEGNVEVYTLGSGCGWRAIGTVSYRMETTFGGVGTYMNGAIYWISSKNVVAFDLAKEEFRLVTSPPCMQNVLPKHKYGLVALGRDLCLYMDKRKSSVEIWSLMRSSDSMKMEFDIDYKALVGSRKRMLQPILLAKGGDIIFLYDKSVLYCYDRKTTLLRMISGEGPARYFRNVEVIAHVSTFVSLEAMGENSKTYTVTPSGLAAVVKEQYDKTSFGFKRSAL